MRKCFESILQGDWKSQYATHHLPHLWFIKLVSVMHLPSMVVSTHRPIFTADQISAACGGPGRVGCL